jgi:hypothetical protein
MLSTVHAGVRRGRAPREEIPQSHTGACLNIAVLSCAFVLCFLHSCSVCAPLLQASVEEKKADTVTKFGAILSAGIIDGGGRNMNIALLSPQGHRRMAVVVGMAMFQQFW